MAMCVVRQRPEPSKKTGKCPWYVDYIDPSGARRQKTPKSGLKRDAEAMRLKIANELDGGDHVPRSQSAKFKVVAEQWLEHCEKRVAAKDNLRPRTLRNIRTWIKHHIEPYLYGRTMADMTIATVQDWIDGLAFDKARPRGRATIEQCVNIVRQILDFAFKKRLMKRADIGPRDLKIPGRKAARREIPTKDELRTVIAGCHQVVQGGPAAWLRPLVYAAAFSGLRQGELRGLKWSKVNFAKGVIRVDEAVDDRSRYDDPKTEAGTREVPIAPVLRAELLRWKDACPASKLGLVFVTRTGAILQQPMIYESWRRLQHRTIGEGPKPKGPDQAAKYTFHDLRHVAASLFIEQGLPPKRIQEIMGHSSITMTFDLYGHLFDAPDLLAKAIANMGEGLAPADPVREKTAAIAA